MSDLSINGSTPLQSALTADPSKSAKTSALEKMISSAEQALSKLHSTSKGSENSAEEARLTSQINRYKSQLSGLQQGNSSNADAENSQIDSDIKRRFDSFECETCKNRRYQDDSDDSGVSFQSATNVAPSAADSAVRAHEYEHVARNKTKAEQNGMKIVSQSVTIHKAICPECGKVYTSGGVTRTKMKTDASAYSVGMFDSEKSSGQGLNIVA